MRLLKKIGIVTIGAVLMLASAANAASAAGAGAQAPIKPFVNRASGKCLDASNWGQGQAVIQYTCHGGNNQAWFVNNVGAPYYELINVASSKCLDFSGTHQAIQLTCNGGADQRWKFVSYLGDWVWVNQTTGKCLDASDWGQGVNVIIYTCHYGTNQRWY